MDGWLVIPHSLTYVYWHSTPHTDEIPEEYGGRLRFDQDPEEHSVRWSSPYEVSLKAHVEAVIARGTISTVPLLHIKNEGETEWLDSVSVSRTDVGQGREGDSVVVSGA